MSTSSDPALNLPTVEKRGSKRTFLINGTIKVEDRTPMTIFPSKVFKFKFNDYAHQVLDPDEFCYDITTRAFDEREALLTKALRNNAKSYANVFTGMDRLKVGPMYSYEDGYALLTPGTDEDDPQWLTYGDERYQKFILDLVNRLLPLCTKDDDIDSVLTLLIDYSFHPPYTSCLRHDGSYAITAKEWPERDRAEFSQFLKVLLRKNYESTDSAAALPPLNAAKSPGFFNSFPDGRPFNRAEHMYVPKSLWTEEPNNIMRYDFSGLKLEWLNSGALYNNVEWFLEHKDRYSEPDIFIQAFERCALNVHLQAYRTNCPDVPHTESRSERKLLSKSVLGELCTKDRVFGFESRDGLSFVSGKVNNKKFHDLYRRKNQNHVFVGNRKRAIFPAPNATFSAPFIFLCRLLMCRLEDSNLGFPRCSTESLQHFHRALSGDWTGRAIVTYDRSNAEQFITDNWNMFITLLPDNLRGVFQGLGTGVLPSTNGPRAICGSLVSGAAPTTFFNAICGLFEMTECIKTIVGCEYTEVVSAFFKAFMNLDDVFSVGDFSFSVTLGTDDTIFYVFSKTMNDDQLSSFVKEKLKTYFDSRCLSGEVTDQTTCFGLDFTLSEVTVSKTRGLGKLFLSEHKENGDAVALSYDMRLQLLPTFYDTIAATFKDHGLGDVSRYHKGARNFMSILQRFGYPVDAIYNVHSPVESIICGQYLEKNGFDVLHRVTKYPVEQMDKIRNLFNHIITN